VSRAVLGNEAWDDEMFAEASRRLATAKPPFLAFLYTATTHTPYSWPSKEWEKFPPDSSQGRYWNSIAYADHALGQFFADARRAGYFDSTIFIVTADHVGGPRRGLRADPAAAHHIPGLILAPGLQPRVDARIGSQLDVIPTIVDLAGWGVPQSALGRSLLADGADRGAFCVEGELLLRIESDGFVLHDLKERVRSGAQSEGVSVDAIEKRLLSIYQVAATLTRQNRLYPPAAELPHP
jgi:phosphoglycerol transferase MdoB-like AlkP superfamily enzyme